LVTFRIIETSGQEGFGQIPNGLATEHVRAEADHVHVVVFHFLLRGKDVMNAARASFTLLAVTHVLTPLSQIATTRSTSPCSTFRVRGTT
jgi:hypothetical protein